MKMKNDDRNDIIECLSAEIESTRNENERLNRKLGEISNECEFFRDVSKTYRERSDNHRVTLVKVAEGLLPSCVSSLEKLIAYCEEMQHMVTAKPKGLSDVLEEARRAVAKVNKYSSTVNR